MLKYKVTFTKIETYEVEANSQEEAENNALEMLNDDEWAFLENPIHEIEVEKID